MEKESVMWLVLVKLNNMGKFGGAHTALRNIARGLPSSIASNREGKRIIEKAIKELVNKGFLLAKSSTGEIHVSLNPKKVKEIREFIQKYR
jgi:hypothetical protein